jgi:hypothetical protein
MEDTYLGFPFDADIFNYYWAQEPDLVRDALLTSGAMVEDPAIAALVNNGSDTYTAPFYKTLAGEPANYDGQTDIPVVGTEGGSTSGVVFGRTQAWSEAQFVRDFNSGANPMQVIASQVAPFWNHRRQATTLGIIGAVMQVAEMKSHVIDAAAPVDETTLGDAAVDALGDNAQAITLAFMHSKVANQLAQKQLVEYAKYTDPEGIERQIRNVAYVNGMLTIIDDSAPTTAASGETKATYTTYLLGAGTIRHATAKCEVPAEVTRDPKTNGGQNTLWTRTRETIHPNGFSFAKPNTGYNASPTDAQLFAKANWSLAFDPKSIALVAVTTQA